MSLDLLSFYTDGGGGTRGTDGGEERRKDVAL